MSRIRSVHPGQWTDEDFVECSFAARLLALGIRNEADDNGVFEWRATRLKMRLFPADDVDVADLLDELHQRGLVLRFEAGERTYGAIRNFRVFQNPRSPKAEHPITPEADRFVGERVGEDAAARRGPGRPRKQQTAENPPSQDKSFPQNVENNSLMERERREENNSPSDSSFGEPTDAPLPALSLVPVGDQTAEAFAAFEQMRHRLNPASRRATLDPDRRKKLTARLVEIGGPAAWADVLHTVAASPFLRGETSRTGQLVATIDWLLKPDNLRKVREGNYDERPTSRHAIRPSVRAGSVDALIEARAILGLG